MVVVISATMSLTINNFELKEHCETAMSQSKALGDKAACIWVPKSNSQLYFTTNGTINLVR